MKSRRFRLTLPMCVAGLMMFALSGCSPRYDWREVSVADGQVRAMFPDKPQATEREFQFEGQDITFVLTSASVDDVLFTVGYATLPETLQEDVPARERLVREVQRSLHHNLGVEAPAELPQAGERFTVLGQGQSDGLRLEAMIWATPRALIEGIIVGTAETLPQDQVTEFLRELAPGQRPASR